MPPIWRVHHTRSGAVQQATDTLLRYKRGEHLVAEKMEVGSREGEARVAYDLMVRIASLEEGQESPKKTRAYWLALYVQCRKASRGDYLETVMKNA